VFQDWNNNGNGEFTGDANSALSAISQETLAEFELDLGSIATACAIKTTSYYMLEFHDEVSQKWMESFANYSKNGFNEGDWYKYLEDMITLDTQIIEVLMRPPKNFRRGNTASKVGNNVLLKYDHELGKFRAKTYCTCFSHYSSF
jgi:hypothetical protein